MTADVKAHEAALAEILRLGRGRLAPALAPPLPLITPAGDVLGAAAARVSSPAEFGIIVTCCAADYMFAYGTCASVRHVLGDLPLCVIVDGRVPTRRFVNDFGARIITRSQISDRTMRQRSFGWGFSKMNAFWDSPWETFLSLDADTVVWGDIMRHADFRRFDFIADLPNYGHPDTAIAAAFFDPVRLHARFPEFPWEKYRSRYFCSGVFFGRRDLFPIDEYKELLRVVAAEPELFVCGEQGCLNFMVFRAVEAGTLRVNQVPLQIIVADFDAAALAERFPMDGDEPAHRNEDVVLHWAGAKPTPYSPGVYSDPMRMFRRQHLSGTRLARYLSTDIILRWQDAFHRWMHGKNHLSMSMRRRLTKAFAVR